MIRSSKDEAIAVSSKQKLCRKYRSVSVLVLAGFVAAAASIILTPANQVASTASEARAWFGPAGKPLPFKTDEQIKDFLLRATIVEMEDIPLGVTDPRKALLEKDGFQANGIVRDVDEYRRMEKLPGIGIRKNWRDCCKFECAAYELGKLLGLNNIPPVVMRDIKGQEVTLQIWLEGALMEQDRVSRNIKPTNPWRHMMQFQVMRVFDALIHNDDRNAGNMLYDKDEKLWLIDHTRCFPLVSDLPKPNLIKYCERNLWEKLQSLDEEVVEERLGEYLKSAELKSLYKRREKLIKYIEKQIAQKGEGGVLFSFRKPQ